MGDAASRCLPRRFRSAERGQLYLSLVGFPKQLLRTCVCVCVHYRAGIAFSLMTWVWFNKQTGRRPSRSVGQTHDLETDVIGLHQNHTGFLRKGVLLLYKNSRNRVINLSAHGCDRWVSHLWQKLPSRLLGNRKELPIY